MTFRVQFKFTFCSPLPFPFLYHHQQNGTERPTSRRTRLSPSNWTMYVSLYHCTGSPLFCLRKFLLTWSPLPITLAALYFTLVGVLNFILRVSQSGEKKKKERKTLILACLFTSAPLHRQNLKLSKFSSLCPIPTP